MDKEKIIKELTEVHPFSKDEITSLYNDVEEYFTSYPLIVIQRYCHILINRARKNATSLDTEFKEMTINPLS